jgi:hypothetical protein
MLLMLFSCPGKKKAAVCGLVAEAVVDTVRRCPRGSKSCSLSILNKSSVDRPPPPQVCK